MLVSHTINIQHVLHGTWYLVPGTWYTRTRIQHSTRITSKYMVSATWYVIPGTRYILGVLGLRIAAYVARCISELARYRSLAAVIHTSARIRGIFVPCSHRRTLQIIDYKAVYLSWLVLLRDLPLIRTNATCLPIHFRLECVNMC